MGVRTDHAMTPRLAMTSTSTVALPRPLRLLAGSNLAAQTAEQLALAAAPIVAVLAFHAREGTTGLLQAAQTLPFLLLTLPAGVLADRWSRRRLLLGGESVRLFALLATLVLLVTGSLNLPWLALLGLLGATGTVVFNVAGPALIPSIAAQDLLARANSRMELARSTAFAAGPALGGLLVGGIGAAAAFALAAVLSMAALLLLRGVDEPPRERAPRRHPLREVAEGAAFVLRHSLLRPVLLTAVFFNLGFFLIQAVYVPYAVQRLHLGAAGIGATMGGYGFGMVLAALAGPRVMKRCRLGAVLAVGPLSGLAASVLMLATLGWPSPWLAGASFFLMGSGPVLWVIASTTLRQAVTPAALIGRASAVIMTATYGARPLGALVGAGLGAAAGAPWCLALAVLAFALQAAIILRSPVFRLQRMPGAPLHVPA
jgi:predicted MFS family arabinose efflux permease